MLARISRCKMAPQYQMTCLAMSNNLFWNKVIKKASKGSFLVSGWSFEGCHHCDRQAGICKSSCTKPTTETVPSWLTPNSTWRRSTCGRGQLMAQPSSTTIGILRQSGCCLILATRAAALCEAPSRCLSFSTPPFRLLQDAHRQRSTKTAQHEIEQCGKVVPAEVSSGFPSLCRSAPPPPTHRHTHVFLCAASFEQHLAHGYWVD